MIRHDPKRQKEREEAKNVDEKDDTLSERQVSCEENVAADSQYDEHENHESRLP